jgi:hypothetical protein
MKQKRINNILYVFQTTPYVITEDIDASTIKVQEEVLKAFVELNESLADKFVPYNYHVVCITQQEWMPYINQPDPEPPVGENYTFTLYPGAERGKIFVNFSDGQTRMATVDDTHMPGNENPIHIEGYGDYEGLVYTYEVPENIEITLRPLNAIENYTYDTAVYTYNDETHFLTPSIVMDADKAVYCVYAEPVEPSTYTLHLEGQNINDSNLKVDIDGAQQDLATLVGGVQVATDTLIEVWLLTENDEDYDTTSISTWMTLSTEGGLHYYANMPSEDKTINISYIGTSA